MHHTNRHVVLGCALLALGCGASTLETPAGSEGDGGVDGGAVSTAFTLEPAPVDASLCPAYRGDCDGRADNGCEADLRTDNSHCGACNAPCLDRENAFGVCTRGVCEQACMQGYASCDGDPWNGCETFTVLDRRNCGACGNTCPADFVCAGGACIPPAPPAPL